MYPDKTTSNYHDETRASIQIYDPNELSCNRNTSLDFKDFVHNLITTIAGEEESTCQHFYNELIN